MPTVPANRSPITRSAASSGSPTSGRTARRFPATSNSYNAGESRIAEIWEDGIRVTWTYDNAYRLTNELRPGTNGFHITHTYDPVGNRTKKTEDGVDTDYTYNAGNQIVTEVTGGSRTTYTFDGAGNQETVESPSDRTTMTWDYENRRTKHETGVIVFEDQYDADGRRFRERFAIGATEQYVRKHVWDQENVLYETNGSNVLQVAYTLEPALYGNLISQRYAGNSRYYHFDALGSTRQLTDSLAAILSAYDYKAYGEPAPGSAIATLDQPYTYVGRLGYYTGIGPGTYIRARWYQPTIIVWLSQDPLYTASVQIGISRPQVAAHGYSYVINNPTNYTDPSGFVPVQCLCARANLMGGFRYTRIVECLGLASNCCKKECDSDQFLDFGLLGCNPDWPGPPPDKRCLEWWPHNWELLNSVDKRVTDPISCATAIFLSQFRYTIPAELGVGIIAYWTELSIAVTSAATFLHVDAFLYYTLIVWCMDRDCRRYEK
ncbi:MAG: RHS repeat-associated core domain-containing protein [Planctomycetota bacterium]